MPKVLRIGSFRFHFYSDEGNEPPHIHIEANDGECKFWLEPIKLARNTMNFTTVENEIIAEPVAVKAWAGSRKIFIALTDGRTISFPADRYKILIKASEEELKQVTLRLNGYALRWENLDEDITVKGIIAGNFQLPLV